MMRERQHKIVEHVQNVGIASFDELAEMFDVSPFTIRRDIDYLAQSRLVARIKGGAQRIETPSQFREARLPNRMQLNLHEKERIAERALEFINPGDSIFLDGSTTIACLARSIAQHKRDITIVTNSVLITLELSEVSNIRVIGIGGIFDPETFSFVGFDADTRDDAFYIDKVFFSCTGLIAGEGTYENAAFNRNSKRLIAHRASQNYLLVDSTKIGQRALYRVLNTDEINTVITDKPLEDGDRVLFEEHQVDVLIA